MGAWNPRENSRGRCLTAPGVTKLNVTGIVVDGDNEGFYAARRYPPSRMNLALITVDFAPRARGISLM